jgi:hypothetical protein
MHSSTGTTCYETHEETVCLQGKMYLHSHMHWLTMGTTNESQLKWGQTRMYFQYDM